MRDPDTVMPEGSASPAPDVDGVSVPAPPRPVIAVRYRRSHRDGERWLRTVAVTGGTIILLATVSGQAVKNGDTAAWLSMLFNGVMALAAVGAYLTARKWVPQLTTQEGYKVAISLVNEEYIYLGMQNPLLSEAGRLMSCYNECLQDPRYISKDDYARKIAALSGAVLREKKRKDSIEQAEFRLHTYGLYEDPAYADALKAMKQSFTGGIDAAGTLEALLLDDLEFQKKLDELEGLSANIVSDMERLLEDRAGQKDVIQKAYSKLERKWYDMMALQEAVFNTHPPIGELYAVRK